MPVANGANDVAVKSSEKQSRTALVLFASETGNGHDAAEEVGRLLERQRFQTVVLDLDSAQLRDLLKPTIVIFVVSTAGQGELPQNGRAFWRSLTSAALKPGVFKRLKFTSFGLGDSSYPRYNVAHRMLHGRMLQLGARTFCERGEGNEQHPEGHSAGLREWIVSLRDQLLTSHPLPGHLSPLADDALIEPKWKLALKQGPNHIHVGSLTLHEGLPSPVPLALNDGYVARLDSIERMTAADHFQDTRLLDFRLDRPFEYGPGAVAVVHPKNFPEDVQQFVDLMHWGDVADTQLQLVQTTDLGTPSPLRHLDLRNVTLTLRWLLENAVDIMAIPRRSFFALLTYFAGAADEDQIFQRDRLTELANPELIDELWDYTTRPKRTILEVMMDFTTVQIPWQHALTVLPVMRGRQFSIASGGELACSGTRVQLLVAIVDPPSPIIKWRRRYGVCTRYIASLQAGQEIMIGMQPGYLDVRPEELKVPVIMIGPGTGIAPMRAMIHHRRMLAASKQLTGDSLYFGCRSRHADFYFQDEWKYFDGLEVHTAFSRDVAEPKQYVQDLIRTNATDVASTLIDRSGKIYLCGSSGNMPKGVREALVNAFAQHTTMPSTTEAEAFLELLEKTGRYKQETW